jgi:hypothetical protein
MRRRFHYTQPVGGAHGKGGSSSSYQRQQHELNIQSKRNPGIVGTPSSSFSTLKPESEEAHKEGKKPKLSEAQKVSL